MVPHIVEQFCRLTCHLRFTRDAQISTPIASASGAFPLESSCTTLALYGVSKGVVNWNSSSRALMKPGRLSTP